MQVLGLFLGGPVSNLSILGERFLNGGRFKVVVSKVSPKLAGQNLTGKVFTACIYFRVPYDIYVQKY